jgi:hypothetical protein
MGIISCLNAFVSLGKPVGGRGKGKVAKRDEKLNFLQIGSKRQEFPWRRQNAFSHVKEKWMDNYRNSQTVLECS